MSNKSGTRLVIPYIIECSDRDIQLWAHYFKELEKLSKKQLLHPIGSLSNNGLLIGSPKVVLKKFLELGFDRKYYDQGLIRFFIAWGFHRKYWDDRHLFVEDLRHLLDDKYAIKVLKEE